MCFRRVYRPSSGAQNFTFGARYLSDQYLKLYVQFWAPEDGRKNRLKHVQRLTEINKLWNVSSCWLHSANMERPFHMRDKGNTHIGSGTQYPEWRNASSCGKLHCVVGWVVPDVSKDCTAFIFKGQQSSSFFLDRLTPKKEAERSYEMPWNTNPTTPRHLPRRLNPQQRRCGKVKCSNLIHQILQSIHKMFG